MSNTATKSAPTYLREARLAAGFANRGTASTEVPFSPETIGRHERGEVPMLPEDVMIYAKSYARNDIPIRYCAQCPVGMATGKQVADRDLPYATLRLTRRLRQAEKDIAETLEYIADDGIVDEKERPVFDATLASLKELGETITDIILYAATQGIEKSRPAIAKAAPNSQFDSIASRRTCQEKDDRRHGKNEMEAH